mmetsp:Transcript_10919/g.26210  ORF Transcript_10919/g.26210 Transcript_10919/m.26210 type:complete len:200 (-) Transcript_10919:147-746(-)
MTELRFKTLGIQLSPIGGSNHPFPPPNQSHRFEDSLPRSHSYSHLTPFTVSCKLSITGSEAPRRALRNRPSGGCGISIASLPTNTTPLCVRTICVGALTCETTTQFLAASPLNILAAPFRWMIHVRSRLLFVTDIPPSLISYSSSRTHAPSCHRLPCLHSSSSNSGPQRLSSKTAIPLEKQQYTDAAKPPSSSEDGVYK